MQGMHPSALVRFSFLGTLCVRCAKPSIDIAGLGPLKAAARIASSIDRGVISLDDWKTEARVQVRVVSYLTPH